MAASPIPPARIAALQALQQTFQRGSDLQFALDAQIRRLQLIQKDANLATELCYGYLRHRGRIAFTLEHFLRKPGNLPPLCRTAFELATYETLFLERIPEFATRSWLTSFVRQKWGPGLTRVATAYMTNIFKTRPALHEPDFYRQNSNDVRVFLSRYYSLPPWIIALWENAYGLEATQHLAQAQIQPAPLGLRINPLHSRKDALIQLCASASAELETLDSLSIACSRETAREAFPDLFADIQGGAISRQSLEAQRILKNMQAGSWQEPIWDVCAGRGGKTCYLLERGHQMVRASDANFTRLQGLLRELGRLALPRIPVAQARAQAPLPWQEQPATILMDVPCSGLGVLSRKPDIKWKRTPGDIPALIQLQDQILSRCAQSLARGGHIAYISCTLNPEENQARIHNFLRLYPDFRLSQEYAPPQSPTTREYFWGAVVQKR